MRSFQISVADDTIVDLRNRLSHSQLLPDSPRRPEAGMSADYLRRRYFDSGDDERIPPVEVPAAVAIQRHEHDYPESNARCFYRGLRSFDRMPEGGHFGVAEAPQSMATRMRDFALELGLLRA